MKTLAWMARRMNVFAKASMVPTPLRRVVVVEHCAEHLEQVLEDAEYQETIVVAESPDDPAPNLAMRVAGRVAQLERSGTPTSSAMLVLGQRHDAGAAAARELVARSLLVHLKAMGGNELAIVAPSAARDDILALVERLLAELETNGSLTIRLKFPSKRPQCAYGAASGPGSSESSERRTDVQANAPH